MLRKAGANVIGKTNTPEWGAGGNTRNVLHGATGNPYAPHLSAAGSSVAQRWLWPAAWCPWRRDRIQADRSAILPGSMVLWVSGPRRA